MYSACLFCHRPLGTNEEIEAFPVGRRLAFDPERGRLWVVCTGCARWNLTPLEERWEAIEACERRYRGTRLRVSTDQIGLARLSEGLELIRIGRPERPEFAAWRYGEQLGKRRRSTMLYVGLGLGALGAVVVGGAAAGIGVSSFGYGLWQLADTIVKGSPNKVIARLSHEESPNPLVVRRKHLSRLHLISQGDEGWAVGVPNQKRMWRFHDDEAVRVIGRLLPQVNRFGGTKDQVRDAVRLLERDVDPLRFIRRVADPGRVATVIRKDALIDGHPRVARLPESMRLAIEMAAHEDAERRAMEGELAMLEAAWQEAEEIAAIADDMFVPTWISDRIAAWKGR
jgi:hypothetical protein